MSRLGRFNLDGTVAEFPTAFGTGEACVPGDYHQAERIGVGEHEFYLLRTNVPHLTDAEVAALLAAEHPPEAAPHDDAEARIAPDFGLAIYADPSTGPAPLSVEFGFSYNYPAEKVAASWDFGDGHGSKKPKITHVFDAPGTYQVILDVAIGADSNAAMIEVVAT